MSESFAELLEESLAGQQTKPGSIITGTVIDVNNDVVIVNAGLKSEAVIPASQFLNEEGEVEVDVGDEVEVALDTVEDGFGETRLSREKAKRAQSWTRLEKAFEGSEAVTGIINGKVKGGFTVDIDDVRAFLPGSLVDVRPVRDTSYLEGKPLEGLWFDRTKEYGARIRGVAYHRLEFATRETVELDPLPCWAHLAEKDYRKRVAELVEEIESETAARHARAGTKPLGVACHIGAIRLCQIPGVESVY